ncbi:MAG: hypothetical protein Q9212_002048 [Teloschistes hypoglaucus]
MARPSSPSQLSLTNILQNNLDDIRNAVVRDITQLFITTAALLPDGESTEDHKKFQQEEAENVEKDKSGPQGLFKARFKPAAYRPPIRDGPDGVDRCPMCTWELEDGMCNSCGYATFHHHAHFADDESVNTDSDMYSMDSVELEEMLTDPANAHALAVESDDPELNQQHPRMIEAMRHRFRSPRYHRWSSMSDSDADDGFSDVTEESVGSLREFVDDIPEMEIDNVSGRMPDYSSDSEQPTSSIDESHSGRSLTPARRRVQRRRVATSSPEPSDSGFSTITRSSQQPSEHSENDMPRSRFSPELQTTDAGHSQDIPIQVDSDSDTPPLRRPRRRRAAVSLSSDEGDSNSQEFNPPHSRTRRSSNEEATRTGVRPPPPSAARRNTHLARVGIARSRAPILIDSSPAPLTISRLSGPRPVTLGHRGARHRRILSETTADESADEETSINESSHVPQRIAPFSPPNYEATDEQRLTPQVVDFGQQSDQLEGPAESHTSSRMTYDQGQQQARIRLKQERRRRRQQEQRASRMGPARPFAYIGV